MSEAAKHTPTEEDIARLIEQLIDRAQQYRTSRYLEVRAALLDRAVSAITSLSTELAGWKQKYDGLLTTWAESRERHLAAEAEAASLKEEQL